MARTSQTTRDTDAKGELLDLASALLHPHIANPVELEQEQHGLRKSSSISDSDGAENSHDLRSEKGKEGCSGERSSDSESDDSESSIDCCREEVREVNLRGKRKSLDTGYMVELEPKQHGLGKSSVIFDAFHEGQPNGSENSDDVWSERRKEGGRGETSSDSEADDSESSIECDTEDVWEVDLGGSWKRFDADIEDAIKIANASGERCVEYAARGQVYVIDIEAMHQMNRRTGVTRGIRCVESCSQVVDEPELMVPLRSDRLNRLVALLLSPAVQVSSQMELTSEPAKLSAEEVRQVFIRHVPGVERFLFRDIPGQFTLKFMVNVYQEGLQAFQGTATNEQIVSLYRVIVHHGHETQSCSRHVRDVAEAFLSCQAEQARVIQRVGLEIQGIQGNFRVLLERLVGEYKILALKILAAERISQGKAWADRNPTHYENRLFADLGNAVGLDKDLVELACLDGHARSRYEVLEGEEAEAAVIRCRELFDLDAVLDAFVAEVNSFSDTCLPDSLPCKFLDWVSKHMKEKHVVLDEATCTQVQVPKSLALVVLEIIFLGMPGSPPEETYRGKSLGELFLL